MMTHRQRILTVMRGEMADRIPFVPRLDLWWLANSARGTLPKKYQGLMPDDISRAEGWACYHMVPNFADIASAEDILHRAIGLFNFRRSAYGWRFSSDVEVTVTGRAGQQVVEYHTPVGRVRTVGGLNEEARKAGSSLGWVQEHALKRPEDCKVMAHLFANLEVFPQLEEARAYRDRVGEDGVVAAGGPSLAASPMHLIQKELIDPTRFFYLYKDHYRELAELAQSIEIYYDKVLAILAESPAEVVLWGANYDDMLTYPPYFEREILPWLKKAAEVLQGRGKIVATHTDGENLGLLDLLAQSGVRVAESVTPYPMTKVRIEEYYARWRDRMTIMGGIPECLLLEETASDEDLKGFLDNLFASVAPGDRLILGIADSIPPHARFDRLLRIAERVDREGKLPLTAGSARPASEARLRETARRLEPAEPVDPRLSAVRDQVLAGDEEALTRWCLTLVAAGVDAAILINGGMIPAMEQIGERFRTGDAFIPEVLLSARAMNAAMQALEPYLAKGAGKTAARVLIGTVWGDMHDIGKNLVSVMLRGVGFEIRDAGINVPAEEFVGQVREFQPRILALSALLTTTMPEMKKVIAALRDAGLREAVKILVGGAPVNQRYADEIGADGYARDAGEAVVVARELLAVRCP